MKFIFSIERKKLENENPKTHRNFYFQLKKSEIYRPKFLLLRKARTEQMKKIKSSRELEMK